MRAIKSWDEGCDFALQKISSLGGHPMFADGFNVDLAQEFFENVSTTISKWIGEGSPAFSEEGIVELFRSAGNVAMEYFTDKDELDLGYIHHVLVGKQRDYGHGNINRFGLTGVAIRLCDKFARLNNLYKRSGAATNESIEDTWLDIIGYATIAIMLHNDWFQLELEENNEVIYAEPF